MITYARNGDDWRCDTQTVGPSVYLDTDCLISLAKGDAARRGRFLATLDRGATLHFSLTNAIELSGPQGASAVAVRRFLEAVGNRWVPLDMNPARIVERELAGHRAPPVSDEFIKSFGDLRVRQLEAAGQAVDPSDPGFATLAAVMDWSQADRDEIRADAESMDAALRPQLQKWRRQYDAGARHVDSFEHEVLRPGHVGGYVFRQLLRILVQEAKAYAFQPHDALDWCHASVAVAFCNFATLDKQWKRRVKRIPEAARLARVYYRPELDQLVADFEGATP